MKCPSCSGALEISDRQGIEVDFCADCRGVWLDRGELDKIVERSSATVARSRGHDDEYDDHDPREKHGVRRNRRSWLGEMFDFGD